MRKTASEFKDFILRGNVIDLAVAVVIGAAFTSVVNSIVKNLINPIVAIPGGSNFSNLHWTIKNNPAPKPDLILAYGQVLDDLISFVIIAAVVFFLVVKPMNHVLDLRNKNQVEEGPTTKTCPECLSTIPLQARRCASCTSEVPVSV